MKYVICEQLGTTGYGAFGVFLNLEEAVVFLKEVRELSSDIGGLVPNKGIRTLKSAKGIKSPGVRYDLTPHSKEG